MGSGSSSQAPKQNVDTVKKEDNLPGSSVPPKGLPFQQNTGKSVVENGSKENRRTSTTTTTTVSGDKRKTSVSNGVKREKTDIRKKRLVSPFM
jgi:hypothetical protein